MSSSSSNILASIFLMAFIASVIKLLNWAWFTPKKLEKMLREQGFHGNPYKLLIGDLRELTTSSKQAQMTSIQFSDDLMAHVMPYTHQIMSKYGQNSFIWLGSKPTLNISKPQLLKEILSKPDIFHKAHPEPIGESIVGGLFYLEDEKWAKHRHIVNPAFRMEKLKNMVPCIALSCSNTLEKWDALLSCNNEMEIDVWPYLENLLGDVISRTSFGSSFEEGKRVFELQNEQLKLSLEILPLTFIPGWRYVPVSANRRLRAYTNEIKTILRDVIERRKKAILELGEKTQGDLLGMLIESNAGEANKGMSVEEMIDECKLFYFAGSETTSVLVLRALVLLCRHLEWQNRAREEVARVFGGAHPTFDGLGRLKIVNMILLEVLRMYPPAPMITRSATKATKLGNMSIPKGVNMWLLTGKLHYDQEIWGSDAEEFRPERFAEGVSSAVKKDVSFSYMPFGWGPRVCVGQNLAMIEAKVILAMMLGRFEFEVGPSYVHTPFSIITMRPQKAAMLLLRKIL